MRIQHNITAMNSYRNFSANNSSLSKNLEKLSSGYKINRAGDDAAGLAISEKMRAQITGLEGATKNAKDGISLIQTAEGALTEVHSMLNRMVTLTEQSANGTYDNDVDRKQLQKEVDALKTEIDRVADSTNFNGLKLLDGSLSGTKPDQASAVTGNIEGISLDATKAKSEIQLGSMAKTDSAVSTESKAEAEFAKMDGAKLNMNIGLNDGTSHTVTLNLVHNTNAKTLEFQDDEGKVLGSITASDYVGATATSAAAQLTDKVVDSFRKAIKGDEALSKDFTAKISTAANAVDSLTLEAKNAGADGKIVDTIDVSVDKGTSKMTNADLATQFGMNNPEATSNNPMVAKVTKGTDAVTAFKAEDIVLYNDNYVDSKDGHKGNADKAVFEVNGHKFAIGLANQTTNNLGADVTFISVNKGKASDASAASDATKYGVKNMTEEVGKGTRSYSTSTNADATIALDASALKHIASEIAKQTGVEVNYDNTTYIDGTSKFDNDETLKATTTGTSAHSTATEAVPMFTIGKQIGKEGKSLTLQIGDTSDEFNKMSVQVADMHVKALGLDNVDISTQEGASEALTKIKDAVNMVSDTRGGLGALQNRLDHTINNLGVMRENIQNAESAIRDTDVAEEMMTYTKNSILNQSAQAMLAQANQLPQGVLQLLG